jgi:hypothetical protein
MKKVSLLLQSVILIIIMLVGSEAYAQLKIGDQPTSIQKSVVLDLQGASNKQGVWLPRISDTTNATGIDGLTPPDGVMIYFSPTKEPMIRRNGYWQSLIPGTGIYSINIGSWTTNNTAIEFELGTAAGGLKDINFDMVPGQGRITLNVPDAASDTRGVVTANSQTFGGFKTFNDGAKVSGNSSYSSNLYLDITSNTSPTSSTDRYLTVDNSGRVILSSLSAVTGLGAIGSSPNANGASISGNTFTLQPASSSFGGIVTTGTQTFAGAKTVTGTGQVIRILPSSASDSYFTVTNNSGNNRVTFGWLASTDVGFLGNSSNTFLEWTQGAGPNVTFTNSSKVGIGITPTANLTLKAGTATANTAPLKLTSGTNLTTPEAGAVEFDGTNYYATSGTTRYTLAKTLTNTAALDFANTASNTSSSLTITVTGAADGDVVSLGVPGAAINANSNYSAYVSAANTVTVVFNNYSAAAINPASGTFRVTIVKY